MVSAVGERDLKHWLIHQCPLYHICRRFLLTLSRHHYDRDLGVQMNAGDFESSYLESEQDHCY